MTRKVALLALFLGIVSWIEGAVAEDPIPLRILYVGNDPERSKHFETFLNEYFVTVSVARRDDFDASAARDADVVLLDWNQREDPWETVKSPLGSFEDWSKPTVLLGSAGLLVAAKWELPGNSGCTCLEPFAYIPADHELFHGPLLIDIKKTTTIKTPEAFQDQMEEDVLDVLPLIGEAEFKDPGWCSYTYTHHHAPELEIICGGVNQKNLNAGAIWRQGYLLHFGFSLPPDCMNDTGKALLVNSIAYIARFSEDRPIVRTPSPFDGGKYLVDRDFLDRNLRKSPPDLSNMSYFFAETEFAAHLKDKSVADVTAWYRQEYDYLHANVDGKIAVDIEARAFGIPPAAQDFLAAAIEALSAPGPRASQARNLLARYAPCGPGDNAAPSDWSAWLEENRDYLFFSDAGGFRWYIDPLAKSRGTPTIELRGAGRATLMPFVIAR